MSSWFCPPQICFFHGLPHFRKWQYQFSSCSVGNFWVTVDSLTTFIQSINKFQEPCLQSISRHSLHLKTFIPATLVWATDSNCWGLQYSSDLLPCFCLSLPSPHPYHSSQNDPKTQVRLYSFLADVIFYSVLFLTVSRYSCLTVCRIY